MNLAMNRWDCAFAWKRVAPLTGIAFPGQGFGAVNTMAVDCRLVDARSGSDAGFDSLPVLLENSHGNQDL